LGCRLRRRRKPVVRRASGNLEKEETKGKEEVNKKRKHDLNPSEAGEKDFKEGRKDKRGEK